MFSLNVPEEPYEMSILPGVSFTVKPLTSFDMAVAQAEARQIIERLESAAATVFEAGMSPKRNVDLSDAAAREALFHSLMLGALAERHIIGWDGVTDKNGQPIAVEVKDARKMIVRLFPIGQIFYAKLTSHYLEMFAAKKEFATAQNGISSPVADDLTATDVPNLN